MDRDETLELYEEARAADSAAVWNAWAEGMLAKRRAMQEAGTWEAGKEEWEEDAAVDFSEHVFEKVAHFGGFNFPAEADFGGATFKMDAWLDRTSFGGAARFDDTTFGGVADYGGARFKTLASFHDVRFEGMAWYQVAQFAGGAWFQGAGFTGGAWFEGCRFGQWADFGAIHCKRSFSLARANFAQVPNFIEAHFAEAPRLDAIRLDSGAAAGGFWRSIFAPAKFVDVPARYRALKRLAIQAHDHDREHQFFAGELRALRGTQDKAFPDLGALLAGKRDELGGCRRLWPGGARFWLGVFYEALSDFGRSFVRPLLWLFLSFAVFSGVYLSSHFAAHEAATGKPYEGSTIYWRLKHHLGLYPFDPRPRPRCIKGKGDPLSAAWQLSLRKSLLFVGWVQAQKINQLNACLFGVTEGYPSPRPQGSFVPRVPDSVFKWSLLQTLISTVLVFLMLLALRNYFRIK